MLDEAATVRGSVGSFAQRHFEERERTCDAEPGLDDDRGDGRYVRQPKPEIIDPMPMRDVANKDQQQARDDEHRDADMQ